MDFDPFSLTQTKNNRDRLFEGLIEAIHGDLQHGCMGRSAPARLTRALGIADKANLKVEKLREIAEKHL